MEQEALVIYDMALPPAAIKDARFLFAGKKTARCKGCFGCWLKTPGECVMHDGSEHIGSIMAKSRSVWIFSEILYGGFSAEVKRVLDRCIPGVLPFFTWRQGRMHHSARYQNRPVFHIVFYNTEAATSNEKALAEKAAKAMAVNMNCSECAIRFIPGAPTEWEAPET